MIYVYNIHEEDHSANENDFYIGRGSPVGNLFSHLNEKGSYYDIVHVDTREEAIENYKKIQFPFEYENHREFREYIDKMYEKFKNGEDIYLGCFCKPKSCHGDVIKEYLEKRFIKEQIEKSKKK